MAHYLTQTSMLALKEALEVAIWSDARASVSWDAYNAAKGTAKILAWARYTADASVADAAKANVAGAMMLARRAGVGLSGSARLKSKENIMSKGYTQKDANKMTVYRIMGKNKNISGPYTYGPDIKSYAKAVKALEQYRQWMPTEILSLVEVKCTVLKV